MAGYKVLYQKNVIYDIIRFASRQHKTLLLWSINLPALFKYASKNRVVSAKEYNRGQEFYTTAGCAEYQLWDGLWLPLSIVGAIAILWQQLSKFSFGGGIMLNNLLYNSAPPLLLHTRHYYYTIMYTIKYSMVGTPQHCGCPSADVWAQLMSPQRRHLRLFSSI